MPYHQFDESINNSTIINVELDASQKHQMIFLG